MNSHFDNLSQFHSRTERLQTGKSLRDKVPRHLHRFWQPPSHRRDPIEVLEESNQGRLPKLIPLRYGRMLKTPFTFFRGAAALMAYDLSFTPSTQIPVQACGDCHLLNFGLFATPERNLVFDINDFDESLPAPWEWDVKRLVTSLVLAGRDNGHADKESQETVRFCVQTYREHLLTYSEMSPLEVWYNRIDIETIINLAPDAMAKKRREAIAEKARKRVIEHLYPKIAEVVGGRHRFVEQPPVLFHIAPETLQEEVEPFLIAYRDSLSDERKTLFDRYRLEDFAVKVVGIGSVGTRCCIGLFFSEDNHPLILQFKEARPSVLEAYTNKSRYRNEGQRVVMGQRLMQSSSDIFLGWTRSSRGFDFYVRQLRDMKLSIAMENISTEHLRRYAEFCGWTLARAHAKSGDATTISGYLGKSDKFDRAMAQFAVAYADQTEKDYQALVEAVKTQRVEALIEKES